MKIRIAIVCDWLTDMGGAEQVLANLLRVFPDAPLYTSFAKTEGLPEPFASADVRPSFLQKLPKMFRKNHRRLFPFYPLGFESLNLREYDVVISASACCAKGIVTGEATKHICYCYTPMRYIWEYKDSYMQGMGRLKKMFYEIFSHCMRLWDFSGAQRVDHFITLSKAVQRRIQKTYRRDSDVIYPPVRCAEFTPSETDGAYYLVISRLVEYKRFDLAVQACTALNRELVVIGDGVERKRLEKMAGPSVRFLGRLPDAEVKKYMAECRALLFPGEEDFGIVPVEAQACGRPVIAFGKGGALDTVVDGETGVLFGEQTVEAVKEAILKIEGMKFEKDRIREHALQFDESVFRRKILEFVEGKMGGHHA